MRVLPKPLTARDRSAIVDLSEIEFLASRGIGLLFANGKKLMRAGHMMVLVNPTGMVQSVLRTAKVDSVTPIAHDLDEAVQVLQKSAGPPASTSPRLDSSEDSSPTRPSELPATAAPLREGEFKLAIENKLSELEGLNAALAQFLAAHGVPYRAGYAVNLAIDELVVNVMRYAYVDDDTHFIDIELVVNGQQIILRIEDDGRPFDPRTGPSLDLHAEDRDAGGLGLILVLDLVDVLNYQRVGEKNCVEVRVHLVGQDEKGDPSTGEQSNV